jgi:hypothetical protein
MPISGMSMVAEKAGHPDWIVPCRDPEETCHRRIADYFLNTPGPGHLRAGEVSGLFTTKHFRTMRSGPN